MIVLIKVIIKITTILANKNYAITPSKIKLIINRWKQRISIIKNVLKKVKNILKSINSKIKRIL